MSKIQIDETHNTWIKESVVLGKAKQVIAHCGERIDAGLLFENIKNNKKMLLLPSEIKDLIKLLKRYE